jgi:hypothetical protein
VDRAVRTEADFAKLSWHDCHVWGIEFLVGDPDEDDWTSELVLNIDYIVEWICGVDRIASFRIAPARLKFLDVTDPRVAIDWGGHTFQTMIHHVIIQKIMRERIVDQKVFPDRPYYRWVIELDSLTKGKIEFGAAGFSQTLLAEPVHSNRQHLTLRERNRLFSR